MRSAHPIGSGKKLMAELRNDIDGVGDALRCELIDLLMEYRSQGRFTRAAQGTKEVRALFLVDLTHSIADILIAAYPNKDSKAYAAALTDAKIIASSVLDGRLLTSHQ
jgi:hypothetical protein